MLHASATTTTTTAPGTQNFLIPNGTFIVELVIFLIVLGIISKWILPPLQQVADARRARIRAALESAEDARIETQRILAERDRALNEARAQARTMIDEANQGADEARERGRQRGQEEYERLLAASREETEEDCRRVRAELVQRLDTLVVAAAERVLGTAVDVNRHRALIDEARRHGRGSELTVASYLAEVVGFLLLAAFIYRYVRPPLKRLMDKQSESIRLSLSSADAAAESGAKALAEARAALEAARSEVTAIAERGHQTSAQLRLEGERRGREEHERLVASAAVEAEFALKRAREEVTRQIGAVVMAATERRRGRRARCLTPADAHRRDDRRRRGHGMRDLLRGYATAALESAAKAGDARRVATDLAGFSRVLLASDPLRNALTDPAIPARARRGVVHDLLEGKAAPESQALLAWAALVEAAAEFPLVVLALLELAEQTADAAEAGRLLLVPPEELLGGRTAVRERIRGYADRLFQEVDRLERIDDIEDELFRFAKIVDANRSLAASRSATRRSPLRRRVGLVEDLLRDKAQPATARLVAYVLKAGHVRDLVGTFEWLAELAARGARPAGGRGALRRRARRVRAPAPCRAALQRTAGHPVEVRVQVDPSVIGRDGRRDRRHRHRRLRTAPSRPAPRNPRPLERHARDLSSWALTMTVPEPDEETQRTPTDA